METPTVVPEYSLSAELVGHERDVRGVKALRSGAVVTTSRDNTVKLWTSDNGAWACKLTFTGHTHFVGPVIEMADGMIATGGYDGMIIVWSTGAAEAQLTLLGHEQAVVALSLTASGDVISGSWDKTVRVWHQGEVAHILRGHQEAVWGVAGAPNGDIWSGSADKTLKIWRGGNCIKTIKDAEDCVRQVKCVTGTGMLVASNDAVVRLYSFEGDALRQLHGHSNYVYTVASLNPSSGELVSGGEDCSVRVWRGDNECEQTLLFPGGVWDLDVATNGDIVVACSDFIARIFSRDPSRKASPEAVALYEGRVKAAASGAATNKVGDLDLTKVQGMEALQEPGQREGQTKVVRKAGGTGAEVWCWQGGKWEKMGDVMNAVDKPGAAAPPRRSDKDYNFDVDFNGQKLVISMNKGDNIYETAVQFIADHDLSEEMIDQVVEHLHKVVPSNAGAELHRNPDPFTGGEAEQTRPGSSAGTGRRGAGYEELSYNPSPWGGSEEPAVVKKAKPAAATAAATAAAFPTTVCVLFDVPGNLAGLCKKATEWGADPQALQALVAKLGSGVFVEADLQPVRTMLGWSDKQRFPALDLLRLLALNQSANALLAKDDVWAKALTAGLAQDSPAPGPMLTLQMLCNCFRWEPLKARLAAQLPQVLDLAADVAQSPVDKVVTALVSLLQNVAVHLASQARGSHFDIKTQAIGVLGEVLGRAVLTPGDALHAVRALGTLVWGDDEARALIADLEIAAKLDRLSKASADATVKKAAADLLHYSTKMDTSH